jgi:hypothetical protein
MIPDRETPRDRSERAVERFLEDESLTSRLVDEAARVLLDWAAARLSAASSPAADLSQIEFRRCSTRLRRIVRWVNEHAGQAPAAQQAERVRVLLSRIEAVGREDAPGERE